MFYGMVVSFMFSELLCNASMLGYDEEDELYVTSKIALSKGIYEVI